MAYIKEQTKDTLIHLESGYPRYQRCMSPKFTICIPDARFIY